MSALSFIQSAISIIFYNGRDVEALKRIESIKKGNPELFSAPEKSLHSSQFEGKQQLADSSTAGAALVGAAGGAAALSLFEDDLFNHDSSEHRFEPSHAQQLALNEERHGASSSAFDSESVSFNPANGMMESYSDSGVDIMGNAMGTDSFDTFGSDAFGTDSFGSGSFGSSWD